MKILHWFFILTLTSTVYSIQRIDTVKKTKPKIKMPMLSLGVHLNGGYAINAPLQDTLSDISSKSLVTSNLASGKKDMNYYYGGGATFRHFLTYLKPVAFLGIYYNFNYSLRESGKANIDPSGDPALRISYSYNGHKSINHTIGLIANFYRKGNLAFLGGMGVVLANETFNYSLTTPTVTDSATLTGSGVGGEMFLMVEYKFLSFLNFFASVNLQVVQINSYDQVNGKTFTKAAPEGLSSDNAQVFQMVAGSTADQVKWDQNGFNVKVGVFVYYF